MFIKNYIALNAIEGQNFNIMRFFYKMMVYAPIDKSQFLALNYLTKIINTLDVKIQDYLIFYKGYFIYSTLTHKQSSVFYDYLYRSEFSMR